MPAAQQEAQTIFPGCSWQCVQQVSPQKLSLSSAVSFSTSGHQAARCLHSKSQNLLSLHPPSMALLAGIFHFLIYFYPFLSQQLFQEGRGYQH